MAAAAPTGGEGGQQGGGGAPASGGDWGGMVATLPESIRGHVDFKNAKGFEDFAQQHVNLSAMVGKNRLAAPEAGWGEKEWNDFYTAIGNPDKPEAYDFKGVDLGEARESTQMLDAFKPIFAKARISPTQAKQLVEGYLGFSKGLGAQAAQLKTAAMPKVMEAHHAKYGGAEAFEKAKATAQAGAEAIFGDELDAFRAIDLPTGVALLDHPKVFELLVQAGKSLEEGGLPRGGAGDPAGGGDPQARLNAFMADPEKQKALNERDHPQHKEVVEEQIRLRAALLEATPKDDVDALRRRMFSPQGFGAR